MTLRPLPEDTLANDLFEMQLQATASRERGPLTEEMIREHIKYAASQPRVDDNASLMHYPLGDPPGDC